MGLVWIWLAMTCIWAARADLFELTQGGHLTGKQIERSATGAPTEEIIVQTAAGSRITLSKLQVKRIIRENDNLLEYQHRSHAMPDRAEAHRELARWCQRCGLQSQADLHLQRLLQLDSEDESARQSLGYQRVGGRWMKRDEIQRSRGLISYDGTYRTPQDIWLRERQKQRKASQADWLRKIKLWRGWLGSRRGARVDEARKNIGAIRNPLAAPALVEFLNREKDDTIRHLLMATLARIDHPASMRKLVDLSLGDPELEVRLQCVGYLVKFKGQVDLFPYIRALHHKDNRIVNRSAVAIGEIGDRAAISPLIDALVTTHKFQVGGDSPGQMNATMSSGPGGTGGGFSFGGGGPKIITEHLQNHDVRQVLVELANGQNFGFDQEAWRNWYVNQETQNRIDTRRDE